MSTNESNVAEAKKTLDQAPVPDKDRMVYDPVKDNKKCEEFRASLEEAAINIVEAEEERLVEEILKGGKTETFIDPNANPETQAK